MKFFVMCSIISMNLFLIISTFTKEVLNLPIEKYYYPSMIVIAIITILYSVYSVIITKKIPLGLLLLVATVIFYLVMYEITPFKAERLPKNNIAFFIMWAMPAAISGIYIKEFKKETVELFFKVVYFVFAITFLSVILIPKLLGTLPGYINFGLMNYQNASYLAAFTVGLGIYFIFKGSIKYKWIYILVALITVPSIFIPGGRGGAILLILYFLVAFIMLTFKNSIPLALKGLIYIFAFTVSSLLIYYIFTKGGNSRSFSYLQNGGLDITDGTSGRGPIYERGMFYIQESPFFGYGPFNYYQLIGNIPHNIIIEILLSFGLIGMLIIVLLTINFLVNFIKNYNPKSIDLLVVFIAIYPITLLMFSTNYLVVSEFWFVLFYFTTKGRCRDE